MSTPGDSNSEPLAQAAKDLARASARLAKAVTEQAAGAAPVVSSGVAKTLRQASEALDRATERSTTQTPKRNKAERTREELLLAAAEVFAEQGIERASMADVAAKAGFTKGALYSNFASKQDLVREVARSAAQISSPKGHSQETEHTAFFLPGASDGTIKEEALVEWLRQSAQNSRILLALELMAYGIRHPELRKEFADMLIVSHSLLAVQVKQLRIARKGGRAARPDDLTPPDERDLDTTTAILSVANQTALLSRLADEASAQPETAARIIARLLESNDRSPELRH